MSSAETTQTTVFPDLCRSCNERVRIDGWFKCPDCESDVDPVTGSFSLVRKETYDDYPDAAVENARMALEAREDTGNPNDCGTQVGWERANQLDNRENLSVDTISRMAAFARHEDNYDPDADRSDCGWMMWKAWGGKEGIEWAEDKLDEIEKSLKSHSTWLINDNQLVRKSDGRVWNEMHPPSPILKERRYVNSPEEVPDEYEAQEGSLGGVYYEVDNGGEDEDTDSDDGGGILGSLESEFDSLTTEEEENKPEEDEVTEQERQELFEDVMQDLPVPNEPKSPEEASGVEPDVDNWENVGDEDTEAVVNAQQALSTGSLLGIGVDVSEVDGDEPFEMETGIPNYDGDRNPTVDFAVDSEDFSNLQSEIHQQFFDATRESHFGTADPDTVEEYAETLENDPDEIPMPYVVLDGDGNVAPDQEGRHRALAAIEAGVEEIPVRFVVDSDRDVQKMTKQEAVDSGSSVVDRDEVEIEGYPNLPPEDARPELVELLKAIDEDEDFDPLEMPVLFELLQDSAPSYKMPKYAVDYAEDDAGEQVCANCEYAYRGMDGRMICSQVRGEIKGEAWCNLFELETRRKSKRRVYVNSPEEVPDEYEPQQGDAGGIYYETGQSVEEERDMDIEELGEALSDIVGQDKAEEIFSSVESPEAAYDYYDAVSEGLEVNFFDPDDVEPGDQIWDSTYGTLTIEEVSGNPAIAMGPDAGHIKLENGVYANIMGNAPPGLEDEVDDEDVLRLGDLRSVEQKETLDRDAFNVESEVDYDSSEVVDVSNGTGTARTLPSEERDQFWDKLEEVHSSAYDLITTMREAKKSSYSNQGQFREKAFLEAAGLRGELDIRNDTLASDEPSDELVAVTDKVRKASQTAFKEEFGQSKEVHRGLSGTAMRSIVSQAIDEETNDVEFDTFGMTNFSTTDGVAEKFANVKKSVTVSKEITADDVLLWSDYFLKANQEGEISIKSEGIDMTLDDLEVPWTDRTLAEELTDPSVEFINAMREEDIIVPEGGVDL